MLSLSEAKLKKYYIALDTETTGLFKKQKHQDDPIKYYKKVPRIVSIGVIIYSDKIIKKYYNLVQVPFKIPKKSIAIHKITNNMCKDGVNIKQVLLDVLDIFNTYPDSVILAHNLNYDISIIKAELYRQNLQLPKLNYFDTGLIINGYRTSLSKLYELCFSRQINTPHHALEDTLICLNCFIQLSYIDDVSNNKCKKCKKCQKYFPVECSFFMNTCFFCQKY